MKMEQTEYSETSAYKNQTPGNYPEESTPHSEHGKSYDMIHLLTAMGLSPGGSTHLHTNKT
jgi:hypothetical protein